MNKLMAAGMLAALLAQPVLAQSSATVAAAKAASSDTVVTLSGSIDRLPSGEYVLRDATDDIRLDLRDDLAPQELDADPEVTIVGRVGRSFAPSDEFDDREPVVVTIVVEQLEVGEPAIRRASN